LEKIGALEEAIQQRSLAGIYSVFYTIAHGDPNFSTGKFMETLDYVKSKKIEGFMQEFDGEELKREEEWDKNYWAYIASSLMDNFCDVRIEHLKKIGQKVYPVVQKPSQVHTGRNIPPASKRQTQIQNQNPLPGRSNKGFSRDKAADLVETASRKIGKKIGQLIRGK